MFIYVLHEKMLVKDSSQKYFYILLFYANIMFILNVKFMYSNVTEMFDLNNILPLVIDTVLHLLLPEFIDLEKNKNFQNIKP